MEPPSLPSFLAALAEARSCLAALADATSYDQSLGYEQPLLRLDAMHGGCFPAPFPVAASIPQLRRRVEARLEALARLGADTLAIELLLAELDDIPSP